MHKEMVKKVSSLTQTKQNNNLETWRDILAEVVRTLGHQKLADSSNNSVKIEINSPPKKLHAKYKYGLHKILGGGYDTALAEQS